MCERESESTSEQTIVARQGFSPTAHSSFAARAHTFTVYAFLIKKFRLIYTVHACHRKNNRISVVWHVSYPKAINFRSNKWLVWFFGQKRGQHNVVVRGAASMIHWWHARPESGIPNTMRTCVKWSNHWANGCGTSWLSICRHPSPLPNDAISHQPSAIEKQSNRRGGQVELQVIVADNECNDDIYRIE